MIFPIAFIIADETLSTGGKVVNQENSTEVWFFYAFQFVVFTQFIQHILQFLPVRIVVGQDLLITEAWATTPMNATTAWGHKYCAK